MNDDENSDSARRENIVVPLDLRGVKKEGIKAGYIQENADKGPLIRPPESVPVPEKRIRFVRKRGEEVRKKGGNHTNRRSTTIAQTYLSPVNSSRGKKCIPGEGPPQNGRI